MSQDIATPETLEQLADDHAATGLLISAATFRAMAKAWKATEKALADAQAENSLLQVTINKARETAARAEALAISTTNTLAASGTKPVRTANEQVPA